MIVTSQRLLDLQNPDGGWGYQQGGGSWTEPACYALMALAAGGSADSDAARRGIEYLSARQRADGGWAPCDAVEESTWVTALVLLIPDELKPRVNQPRAVSWLLDQTGRETTFVQRLRWRLLGMQVDQHPFSGWPWFPGATAWVTPTALSILAFEKHRRKTGEARLSDRIDQGRAFLWARRCRDGGWNHGSTHALGYDSDSYPETTGAAVLALHGSNPEEMPSALLVAERHLSACKSLEAASWLTLGLLANGKTPLEAAISDHGGTTEISLAAIAQAARKGRNLFLD